MIRIMHLCRGRTLTDLNYAFPKLIYIKKRYS